MFVDCRLVENGKGWWLIWGDSLRLFWSCLGLPLTLKTCVDVDFSHHFDY